MQVLKASVFVGVAAASLALAACGGGSMAPGAGAPPAPSSGSAAPPPSPVTPIQHVVLVIQENRTFNDFFATYPGADGTTTGQIEADSACGISKNETISLTESPLATKKDLNHSYPAYRTARNGGAMNGFDQVPFGNGIPECTYPYQYTNPDAIQPYWDMAQSYTLIEHMFTLQGSSSFTAHQDLVAGGTEIAPNEAIVDLPSCSNCIWGCDAPTGTKTSLITENDDYEPGAGPFPCFSYKTMAALLDAKSVSWRYYAPQMCCNIFGKLLSAYDAIDAIRHGPDWTNGDISTPQTNIFTDITNGKLQAVSWLIPTEPDSDHPGDPTDDGPSWVASVVNAIGNSSYWNSTAIVVVWDDWGGLYDNLNPNQVGYGGLGFRVPALVISPYAKPGYIAKTYYDFGSILKFIENNWDLGTLGAGDENATGIGDCFNFNQAPLKFKTIPSERSQSYFMHEKPPNLPTDTDM